MFYRAMDLISYGLHHRIKPLSKINLINSFIILINVTLAHL